MSNYRGQSLSSAINKLPIQRGLLFGIIIVTALLAFELFNYSTTDYALSDLLGELSFMGISWATILAIAFCGIDFAGIARLFTPQLGGKEQGEVWYLFGAWMLAATMNATLTWWGVSLAILNHANLGNEVINRAVLLKTVPIFIAVLVWLIRVLIIGTFSVAGERLFSVGDNLRQYEPRSYQPVVAHSAPPAAIRSLSSRPAAPAAPRMASAPPAFNPAPKQANPAAEPVYSRQEPTYHPVMNAAPATQGKTTYVPGYKNGPQVRS